MKVIKGSKITKTYAPYYTTLSNAYYQIEEFSENPGPPLETQTKIQRVLPKHHITFKIKAAHSFQKTFEAYMSKMNDNYIINLYIKKAEDERTVMAKNNSMNVRRITIDAAHAYTSKPNPKHDLVQQGKNFGYALSTTVRRLVQKL